MPSPLPGMNPYLENPEFWSEFHSRMIIAIADALDDCLSRDYRVAVEKRVYLSDEEVQERFLEIREGATGNIITIIELISPKNKRNGEGRSTYLQKRQKILISATHLIEIDLLRGGEPFPMGAVIPSDYRIMISRSYQRPKAQLYAFNLQQIIPSMTVPLRSGENEPVLNLQSLLHKVYDRARFELGIEYKQACIPRLSKENEAWLRSIIL